MLTKNDTQPYYFSLIRTTILIWLLICPGLTAIAQETNYDSQECMLELLRTGQDELTLGEIRKLCRGAIEPTVAADKESAAESGTYSDGASRRMAADREAAANPFSILAHKPNYFLAAAYNSRGWSPALYRQAFKDPAYTNQDTEAQFQISLKVPLALDLFGGHMDIYGAYTNRSFWQMYNREYSEPFRETNHEPEAWLQFGNDWQILGFTNIVNTIGAVHQSNGKAGVLSRSWNRVYANFIFGKDDLAISFKPWVWVTRDKSASDNPDITDFMGHGEFRAVWQTNGHVLSMMLRNQLESGFDRGAVELGWSIPIFNYPYLKGYVQYFYGYGESLIDYDRKVNRIGVGISVTDWID